MFYYLKGTAAHLGPNLAVIDCGGVGYACRTTSYTLSALQIGAPAQLYTHLNVREDAMELYGFSTENERNCFELLIGVSRLLARGGTCVFSCNLRSFSLDADALARAGVVAEDVTERTMPWDFARDRRVHHCFLVRRA